MFWDKWFRKSTPEAIYSIKLNESGVKQLNELHKRITDFTGKERDIVFTWDLIISYGISAVNNELNKYTGSKSPNDHKFKLRIVKPDPKDDNKD